MMDYAKNVTVRGGRGGLAVFIDGKYLGKVEIVDGEDVYVLLNPRSFRAEVDPRDQEIADLKDSNERLADALRAAKVRAGDTW